uniref:hypothetical protein n=1 Tax=Klebsiella sp. TaxID=576 RepID=UPI00258B200A
SGDYRKLLYKYNIHHDLPAFWLNRIPLPANYAYYPQMQRHPLNNLRCRKAAMQQAFGSIAPLCVQANRRADGAKGDGDKPTLSKWNS